MEFWSDSVFAFGFGGFPRKARERAGQLTNRPANMCKLLEACDVIRSDKHLVPVYGKSLSQ